MVDLPEADRPVNQTVQPFCLRSSLRSWRVRPECQVMLLSPCQIMVVRVVVEEEQSGGEALTLTC